MEVWLEENTVWHRIFISIKKIADDSWFHAAKKDPSLVFFFLFQCLSHYPVTVISASTEPKEKHLKL